MEAAICNIKKYIVVGSYIYDKVIHVTQLMIKEKTKVTVKLKDACSLKLKFG